MDPADLRIVNYPAPVLLQRAEPVDPADPVVQAVARRMIELMHEADGLGLAAPQVGLSWRMFVTNARDHDPEDRVYMNPEVTLEPGPLESAEEGCLSLPGLTVQVRRPPAARIRAVGLDGAVFELAADGLLSRVWQHENDHLDGVLIIDRMSPMDRLSTRKLLKEMRADAASVES